LWFVVLVVTVDKNYEIRGLAPFVQIIFVVAVALFTFTTLHLMDFFMSTGAVEKLAQDP
jgi:hypothetical protein